MKHLRHLLDGQHGDVRRQEAVQRTVPFLGREPGRGGEVCHLAERVHAGVGTAGADHVHVMLGDLADGRFDRALDGRQVRLDLPAMIGGAVVLQHQLECGHSEPGC